ncbi:hypothetical protein KI387_039377, partial [Taxus chinensis]
IEHTMMTYVESESDDVELGSELDMMENLTLDGVSGVMDVGVTSSVAHETVTEIGITGSDHLSLSLYWLSEVSVDWRSHLLVEYSKNRHTCEILDGHIQDDNYRLEDEMIFYQ